MGKASPKSILISCVILFLISGIMYLSIRNTQEVEEAKSTCTTEQQKAKTSIVPADQKDDRTSADSGKHFTWYDSALEALSDPNVSARVQAVLGLRNYPSPEAVDLLSKFLDDKEIAVVSEAVDTLGVIGSNSEIKDLVLGVLKKRPGIGSFLQEVKRS